MIMPFRYLWSNVNKSIRTRSCGRLVTIYWYAPLTTIINGESMTGLLCLYDSYYISERMQGI